MHLWEGKRLRNCFVSPKDPLLSQFVSSPVQEKIIINKQIHKTNGRTRALKGWWKGVLFHGNHCSLKGNRDNTGQPKLQLSKSK